MGLIQNKTGKIKLWVHHSKREGVTMIARLLVENVIAIMIVRNKWKLRMTSFANCTGWPHPRPLSKREG